MLRLEVTHGRATGTRHESSAGVVRLGRAVGNDLVLPDEGVSGEHARIIAGDESYVLRDLRSTNGTVVVRGQARIALDDANGRELLLASNDVVELGAGADVARLTVTVQDDLRSDEGTRVLATRTIDDLGTAESRVERDESRLRALYDAQKRIGAADGLHDVLTAICAGAFDLVPGATHVTVVLREDDEDAPRGTPSYVPVVTRVRGQKGSAAAPIPVTRSVFRTGVFTTADLDVCAVLAHNASLAVANARLVQRLRAAEERMAKENAFLKTREESRRVGKGEQEIIGSSAAMRALFDQVGKVVDTRVTVLIEGETGVGKELIAAAVHYRSRRRDKLFVSQNCAAMPENLLESELFGHKKGSFTGAHEEKKGLFEIADGGTLFLDEVTEMPLSLQSKLLRVLQEGEIRAIGATAEKRVNVRIVAATNRNLEKEVAEGRFREDLYYRLKVFPLRVPPLRERREDVPLLASHFLTRYATELGKSAGGFSQQAMELLQGYDWPGNVRELQNEVQRLVIQLDPGGFVTPDLLSPRVRHVECMIERVKPTKGTLKEMMDQLERWLLIEALREHKNNKTVAARALGITREGLHKKLRGFGL